MTTSVVYLPHHSQVLAFSLLASNGLFLYVTGLLVIAFVIFIFDGKIFVEPVALNYVCLSSALFAGEGLIHTVSIMYRNL